MTNVTISALFIPWYPDNILGRPLDHLGLSWHTCWETNTLYLGRYKVDKVATKIFRARPSTMMLYENQRLPRDIWTWSSLFSYLSRIRFWGLCGPLHARACLKAQLGNLEKPGCHMEPIEAFVGYDICWAHWSINTCFITQSSHCTVTTMWLFPWGCIPVVSFTKKMISGFDFFLELCGGWQLHHPMTWPIKRISN